MLVQIFFGGFGRRVYLPEKIQVNAWIQYLKWWALEKVTPAIDSNLGESIWSTPHPGFQSPPGLYRIITFFVGNPYKPSFATVTGWGVDPRYLYLDLLV